MIEFQEDAIETYFIPSNTTTRSYNASPDVTKKISKLTEVLLTRDRYNEIANIDCYFNPPCMNAKIQMG